MAVTINPAYADKIEVDILAPDWMSGCYRQWERMGENGREWERYMRCFWDDLGMIWENVGMIWAALGMISGSCLDDVDSFCVWYGSDSFGDGVG